MCAHMELKQEQKVVIVLPFSWDEKPTWYRNCVTSIQYPDRHRGHRSILVQWFRTHCNAELCWNDGDWRHSASHIEFPDQETYTQCVLTWS